MNALESRAESEFGLPANASPRHRAAYLEYLDEQIRTTCSPDIWPPLSFDEWRRIR